MSLHRVSSISSYEQVRGSSPARSEHRKMSFNPVGKWDPPVVIEERQGFQVSKPKRILQVTVAVVYCLFSAGVIFGYAALKPVLIEEGVYGEYCSKDEIASTRKICYEQEIRLNFMFTTAAVATNICALPVGTILDRYGPRVSGIVGSVLLAVGAILLAIAAEMPFDAYIPGYLFLALGGPFVFISSFHLSNTFPRYSGLILALLTGAFDSSSAIFLFYRLVYAATSNSFTLKKFFLIYLIVPFFIVFVQIVIMPTASYKTLGEVAAHDESLTNHGLQSEVSESTALLHQHASTEEQQEQRKRQISGVWGVLHGKPALEQIRTPWFVLITLFTIVQMIRINYFVATIWTQYSYMLKNDDLATKINNVFDVALPAGGVLSIPLIGLILDNCGTPFVLALLVMVATAIGLLGMLPFAWAAFANVALFVLYRPLYYTAVSDYAAKVFGFQTFGKVYGLIICLAGLLNFGQSALDAITHKVFHRDPLPINIILLILALVIGAFLVAYVSYKSKHIKRDRLEEEAEATPDVRIPGNTWT